jgi:hypothetical protein
VKAAGHIKVCDNAILPIGAVAVKKANAKKEEKKEDDLDDLFGDDELNKIFSNNLFIEGFDIN